MAEYPSNHLSDSLYNLPTLSIYLSADIAVELLAPLYVGFYLQISPQFATYYRLARALA